MAKILADFSSFTLDTIVTVDSYEQLTPDSYIWQLTADDDIYILYAEDYVESLDSVREKIEDAKGMIGGEFIKVVPNKPIDEELAVIASTHDDPEYSDFLQNFAVTSGYDSVFLFKVSENSDIYSESGAHHG
ncbi:MAG: hypothetical protein ABIQ04_01925 [Candidatus Saccharimonadales bacterium]